VDVNLESSLPNSRALRRTFNRLADLYDGHAALEQEVASRLLERLEFHRLPPQRIIDLGCGTGQASADLKSRFRKAQVIGLDGSRAMLTLMRRRSRLLRPLKAVCADFSALPLADQSSELLYSNLALQWCPDLVSLFAEFRRILIPGGMLLFSSLGPDSLGELRSAWAGADETAHIREFTDMLEVGDALMAAGFQEPVMDTERITLSYPDIDALICELQATGTSGFLQGRYSMREAKESIEKAYQAFRIDGTYPVTYQIIYGTAFGPQEGQPRKTPQGDLVTFSVESLKRGAQKQSDRSVG
jgi:malonyl-CoA O-methyltransferase